jgi:hypothetical protein
VGNPALLSLPGNGSFSGRVRGGSVAPTVAGPQRWDTGPSIATAEFWDDFARPDGPIGTAPTGQTYGDEHGFYLAEVMGGRLELPVGAVGGPRAAYPSIECWPPRRPR